MQIIRKHGRVAKENNRYDFNDKYRIQIYPRRHKDEPLNGSTSKILGSGMEN